MQLFFSFFCNFAGGVKHKNIVTNKLITFIWK